MDNIMSSAIAIKMKNPSFSVYMDNQNKNTPPNEDFLQQHMSKIYPKPTKEWVDDTMVKRCQSCKDEFGFLSRKHHCRACGGVFCSSCCNIYTVIPDHLIDKPDENRSLKVSVTNLYHSWNHNNKSLVCTECNNKIIKLLKIEWIIKICQYCDLNVLYKILVLNRDWHNAAIHWLSKFRNIQYMQSEINYSDWECNILWCSREDIISHNNWYCSLIKSVLYSHIKRKTFDRLNKLKILVKESNFNNKRVGCWSLMCSRKCNFDPDILDVLDIIQYICKIENGVTAFWADPNLRELITILINKVTQKNYRPDKNIIPLLSMSLRMLLDTDIQFKHSNKYIKDILDKISANDYNFLIILAFEFNHLNINTSYNNIGKNNFCAIVKEYIRIKLKPDQKKMIVDTINTIVLINTNRKNILQNNNEEIDDKLPILYPFNTEYIITDIIEIVELPSNSKPLLVSVYIKKINDREKIDKKFIIKNDPYLRKENIVSSLIPLLQSKLYSQSRKGRLAKFDMIPSYGIIPIGNIGIIEYVPDSITLRQISLKQYTLANYIVECNTNQKIDVLKDIFIKSLAISSCLSYILGLGDRHLDNIMINKKGQIFHIDYGYLLENPITNIFGAPVIRVTSEMIDFLGGPQSKFYSGFKQYVIQVFDILRLYGNIILNYYFILGHENIIDWEDFRRKITNRFLNGLSCKDVEISLIKEIEMSSNSYSAYFIDVCHHYSGKVKTLFK